ncbi:MAG: SH3 domain-containing protein [Pseudonocardiales bacterium]
MFRQRVTTVLAIAAIGFTGVIGTALAAPAAAASATTAVAQSGDTQVAQRQCAIFRVNARDGLNVRSGPGTNYPIVDRLNYGSRVLASRRVVNGFRELADQGRWASDRYLTFIGPWGPCPS